MLYNIARFGSRRAYKNGKNGAAAATTGVVLIMDIIADVNTDIPFARPF